MPRSPKDNQEIREARRQEILRAAAHVFAEHGFARAKISDIASSAGISYGLLYHYYSSKADVFGALVDAMIERIDEDFEHPGERAYEKLVGSMERVHRRFSSPEIEANRLLAQAMLQGALPDGIHERLADHLTSVYQRTVDRIAEAQRDGDIDPGADPRELASALLFIFRGMSIRLPGMPVPSVPLPSVETILRLLPGRAPTPCDPED